MRKKFVHFLWSLILFGTAFCVFMFILIWNGWIGYMPDMKELQNPIRGVQVGQLVLLTVVDGSDDTAAGRQ